MSQRGNTGEDVALLVGQAQAGDRRAFDGIVRRFQDRAVGYAYVLLGDIHKAEDVAQDAFLQAFRDLPSLREAVTFPRWLNRIVFKCCHRVLRRKTHPLIARESPVEITDMRPDSDPVRALEAAEQSSQVRAAIQALPEAERTVVTLFYLGEHSQAEIAEFIKVPITTVKKRLQRARARLRERMLTMVQDTLLRSAPSRDLRFAEVANLLRRLTDSLWGDERVVAAYLAHFGEDEGFGPTDDVWSSLNVHVILTNDAIDTLATGRQAFAATLGTPLLMVEGPQNAPPGGYYLMALYDGEAGPYEVDWYWQAQATANLPSETRLLFDRAGIPISQQATAWAYTSEVPPALADVLAARSPGEKQAEELRNQVSLFWAMWLITAKYVARNPNEERMGFLPMLYDLLRNAGIQAGQIEEATKSTELPPTPEPADKLKVLRQIAGKMETLMSRTTAKDGQTTDIPVAVVPRAYRFLDMVEASLNGGAMSA